MDERGSILTTVLLLAGLLILLALPVLQMATAGYTASVNEQVKTQAFYLAEAGLKHGRELALSTLREQAERVGWNPQSIIGPAPFVVARPSSHLSMGTYEAEVWLTHLNGNEYEVLITATGVANSVNRLAQKVSERLPVTIQAGSAGGAVLDGAMFSNGRLELSGSSTIVGNVATNSTADSSMVITGTSHILGQLFVGPGADAEKVVTGRKLSDAVIGTTASLSNRREYPPITMPPLPNLGPSLGDFTAGWWPSPPYYIDGEDDRQYSNLVVNSTLVINVGENNDSVRRIRVKTLKIDPGKLVLQGQGKLILYVEDQLIMAGGGALNAGGRSEQVFIYYYGSRAFSLPGNEKLHGSVQALKADVTISGSSQFMGSIITGGTTVNVTGGAATQVSLVYAPHAAVKVAGSGRVEGAVVSDSCSVTGHSHITFNDKVQEVFQELVGASGSSIIVGPGVWRPR